VSGLGLGRGSAGGCLWSQRMFLPEGRGGVMLAPREMGRGVPGGGECWHGRWQLPGPDCLGGWVRSLSRDGVGCEGWRGVP